MNIVNILLLLGIAGICGGIAQAIVGFTWGGCFTSIVLGFIGAFLGWWIADILDLPLFYQIVIQGRSYPVVWSIIGGMVFVTILDIVSGN